MGTEQIIRTKCDRCSAVNERNADDVENNDLPTDWSDILITRQEIDDQTNFAATLCLHCTTEAIAVISKT